MFSKYVYHADDRRSLIFQQDNGLYAVQYEEYFNELGWHSSLPIERDNTKELIEWLYEIEVA